MDEVDDLAELAAALGIPYDGLVIMLFAYFDESGTDGQDDIVIISGFVAKLSDWLSFNGVWRQRLDDDGIKTFHYVDCKGRNREYRGWTRDRSAQHLEGLSNIVARKPLAGISAGFIGNYKRALERNPQGERVSTRFPTAYSFVFEMLIDKIRREMNPGSNQRIHLIFARQTQFQSRALEVFNWHKDGGYWPEIAALSYAEPKDVIPLQAADMISWETRRYLWNKDPDSWRALPLLRRLIPKNEEDGKSLYEVAHTEDALASFDLSSVG